MNKNQKANFDTIHYLISVIKSLKNQSVKKTILYYPREAP